MSSLDTRCWAIQSTFCTAWRPCTAFPYAVHLIQHFDVWVSRNGTPKRTVKKGRASEYPLVVNKTKLQQAPGKPRSNFRAKNMKYHFHFSQLPPPSGHRGYWLLSYNCHVYVQCTINFEWAAELHKCKERGKPFSELVLCSYNWLTMVLKLQQLPAASSSTDCFQTAHPHQAFGMGP